MRILFLLVLWISGNQKCMGEKKKAKFFSLSVNGMQMGGSI